MCPSQNIRTLTLNISYPLMTQPLRKAVNMLFLKQFNAREEFFAITRVHLNIYCTFLLRRSYTRKIVRKFSQSAKSTTPKMKISRPFIWTFSRLLFVLSRFEVITLTSHHSKLDDSHSKHTNSKQFIKELK